MSALDDITVGLDEIRRSVYVSGTTKKSYRSGHAAEYGRVMAYLDGGALPSPFPTTLMGSGLTKVERGRRALIPPIPPPPSDWPASYFTGPLGSRNPVPSKGKVFLIEMYGGIGTTYRPDGWNAMLQREADMGRKFDALHYIIDRSYDMPGDIISHGSLPLFTWMPGSPAQVNAGALDSAIDSMADYLKSYAPHVIIVRLFREFDIPFLAEHACGSEFISAWRRVVDRFQARGADNVGWWWTPTEGTDRACINASWPGDDYVDWSGVDQYNMYLDGQVSPLHPGWAEFWEIVHYGTNCQHDIWGPRKPFVIGETSTHPDLQNPPHKGDWWRNIPKAIRGEQGNQGPMEWLCGISFYDCDVRAAEGPNANYRVDWPTNVPEIYAGWLAMCADPVWNRGGIV